MKLCLAARLPDNRPPARQESIRKFEPNIIKSRHRCELVSSVLVATVLAMSLKPCDTLVGGLPRRAVAPAAPDANPQPAARMRPLESGELIEAAGGADKPAARFAPDDPNELVVVASSWQNEVYLPCKILGLADDQTVSRVVVRPRDQGRSWASVCVALFVQPTPGQTSFNWCALPRGVRALVPTPAHQVRRGPGAQSDSSEGRWREPASRPE